MGQFSNYIYESVWDRKMAVSRNITAIMQINKPISSATTTAVSMRQN
jgi:hypothetical protein